MTNEQWWRAGRRRVGERLRDRLGVTRVATGLATELEHRSAVVASLHGEVARLQSEIDEQRRELNVWTTMTWLAEAAVTEGPTISVVMPTRDRRPWLERAVPSVLAQTYSRWELIVVDDGSSDDSAGFVAGIDDPRVHVVQADGVGVGAARNRGLARATGDLVAYLDDDNRMHPLWLKAVAWAAETNPDAAVFYGARIFDSFERAHGLGTGGTPWFHFRPWDREQLEEYNIADMNVLAHRRDLPEAHFDEDLAQFGDWDLFLRLTEEAAPVEVPAVACIYATDAPGRLSGSDQQAGEIAAVRAKLAGRRERAAADRPSPTEVLVVALDAFAPRIASELAEEGHLPNLRRVLQHAARVEVRSPPGVFVSALWPTIFTGVDPADHGYTCWIEVEPETYEERWTELAEIRGEPFWDTLARAGRRVAVLDVPHSWPSHELDGVDQVQLVEWGAHDRHVGTGSVPPGLAEDLDRRFGPHPVGGVDPHTVRTFAPCDYLHRDGAHRTPAEARVLADALLTGAGRKEAASLDLLRRGGWDLFLTVLGEAHCTGHQFWSVHDPDHPRHDPAVRGAVGDALVAVYERLDAVLGAHLEAVGDDTTVLVLLSHGMGPKYTGTHLLDAVLHRIEVADAGGPQGSPATRVAKRMWDRSPDPVADRLDRIAAAALRRRLRRGDPAADVLPSRSTRRWFQVPINDPPGGIRLNVVGREPQGIVHPGPEYDRACAHLRDELLALVNVETGEPAVREVVRSDAIYERRDSDAFPDLFVEWNRRRPVEAVYSRRVGLVVDRDEHWRTGDHWPDGLLLAFGPGIPEGALLPTTRAVDLAPTLAALLGVEFTGAAGRPIDAITRARPAERAERG